MLIHNWMSAWFMPASFEVLRLKWPQDMNLHENDPQVILWLVLTDVCHLFSWGSISLLILANGCSTVEKHTTRNVTPLSPKKLSTVIIGPWISFRTHFLAPFGYHLERRKRSILVWIVTQSFRRKVDYRWSLTILAEYDVFKENMMVLYWPVVGQPQTNMI